MSLADRLSNIIQGSAGEIRQLERSASPGSAEAETSRKPQTWRRSLDRQLSTAPRCALHARLHVDVWKSAARFRCSPAKHISHMHMRTHLHSCTIFHRGNHPCWHIGLSLSDLVGIMIFLASYVVSCCSLGLHLLSRAASRRTSSQIQRHGIVKRVGAIQFSSPLDQLHPSGAESVLSMSGRGTRVASVTQPRSPDIAHTFRGILRCPLQPVPSFQAIGYH
jgi:hypothetical protein